MPLPDFFKRKKSQVPSNSNLAHESPARQKSENGKVHYPLERFSEELFSLGTSSDEVSTHLFSFDPGEKSNGLAKSFTDVLSNPNALGYFIQFMDSRSSVPLVKFCLDVRSFQASLDAEASNSHNDHLNSNDFGNFQSACSPGPDLDNVIDCDSANSNCDETHDRLSSKRTENFRVVQCIDNSNSRHSANHNSSSNGLNGVTGLHLMEENGNMEDELCPTSPSSESIDSGISRSESSCPIGLDHLTSVDGHNHVSDLTSEVQNNQSASHNLTPEEQLLLNQTKDALSIYQKYVAPESPMEIEFPLDVKHSIVTGICSESGLLDSTCFDSALQFVTETVQKHFFTDFMQSEYNAKHQVDVLSQDGGRNVNIMDILENEVLLFHFMEFLENSEGRNFSSLLEFWISANNLRQSVAEDDSLQNDNLKFLRNDAIAIYDKFVSLQATSPLGFSSAIRSRIEEKICCDNGQIDSGCFDEALQLVVRVLHMKYVQKFINSQLFKNYITELMTTIASAANSCSTPGCSSLKLRNGESSTSLNTSAYSETCNVSISAQNTLLATSSSSRKTLNKGGGSLDRTDPNFLDLCSDPDHLWKRKSNSITNIGRVDFLGRYTSQFDAPPDVASLATHEAMGSKISRVVRRMMTNADVERQKEEMAWQMAAIIVSDVTSRAEPDKPDTET